MAPPQNPPAAALGSYRIAGRVVNAATGEPVGRATVAALAEEDSHLVETTQSDSDGRFALEQLSAGKYPLTASRRGFRTAFYDEHDEYNSAIVTGPAQDTSHLVFRLMPNAVLHGVVTGDGGDPAENASVILFKRQHGSAHDGGQGEVRQSDATITDDTGAYEFSNLAAGEYYVAVMTSPWYAMHPPARADVANQESPLDVAYPVTFFDSTSDEASATPIALEAGIRQEADISLHAVAALRLQVSVPRKGGGGIVQPELRTMVFGNQLSAESSGGFDPAHTGVVEFAGVAPGRYELVQGDPRRISDFDASSSEVVDANAGTLAVTVSGKLRTASGTPLPENVNVMLLNAGNQQSMPSNAHKGEFSFEDVAAGSWGLTANVEGKDLPVIAVAAGGSVTPGNQITVKDRPLAVVATVSSSLSRVQGFAGREGKGATGAMIVLVPRQPSAYRALVRRDQSDSDGSFNLRDVPAGQYTVVAIEDGWKLDWTDRASLLRYLPGGVAVTVSDQAGGVVRLSEPVRVQ